MHGLGSWCVPKLLQMFIIGNTLLSDDSIVGERCFGCVLK